MKPANQITAEQSLTEFDKKMIEQMKKKHELQNWTDQDFVEYCNILRCYSMLIISSVINENTKQEQQPLFTLNLSTLKQVA